MRRNSDFSQTGHNIRGSIMKYLLIALLLFCTSCAVLQALVEPGVETDGRGDAIKKGASDLGTLATGSRWIGDLIGGIVLAGAGAAGLVKYKRTKSHLQQGIDLLVGAVEDNRSVKAVKARVADADHSAVEAAVEKLNGDS